jgi:KaiC/GvpD/RAD55 family RecA-like ATPase
MISIQPNSAAIAVSPPLSGKKEFIYSHLIQSLKNKEPVIFLSTDISTEEIKRDLVKNKIFYGPYASILRFIDCYSQQAGNNVQDTSDTIRVPGPIALNEISIAISQLETEFYRISPSHIVLFDSLSTLLMYSNPQMIGRFLQVLIAKIKNAGGSVLFTLEEGMHDPKDMIPIEHLMNAIIHIKQEQGKILIKAEGISGLEDWTEL